MILSLLSLTVFFNSSESGGLLIGVNGKLETLCIVGDNIPPGILFSLRGNHQQNSFLEINLSSFLFLGLYVHGPGGGI